jgi:hypothetical protein
MNYKSLKSIEPILAPLLKVFHEISNVMFVTPNKITVMYQIWSHLSGKILMESCVLMKNDLPNIKFSGTCSFMKIGSCSFTNNFSR